ncbi:MAG: SDR family NAD(P)-dependent oxidoreductase [Bacteroidota bacterium]|nr:SDR family NAD(P)-dependent oxidoreductase [Bacteroidota bacterium]
MKRAIVLGASSGIGQGVARELVKEGYRVGITGRRTELLEKLKAENPENYIFQTFDITDITTSVNHLKELVDKMGGLDLLLINSGTGHRNEALDFEVEKPAILTNVLGFTAIADWAFNYFREKEKGQIAVVSSVAGIRGMRFAPAYGASKAYQINYMQALRNKARNLNLPIVISDIRPGFVDTAMAQGEGIFWVASVEKAARQIVSSLLREDEIIYVSRRWRGMAQLIRLIPRFLYEKI